MVSSSDKFESGNVHDQDICNLKTNFDSNTQVDYKDITRQVSFRNSIENSIFLNASIEFFAFFMK